jgi:hypothetical protein
MRASPIILGTTLALSFALLLISNTSNAQSSKGIFGGADCTAGNGLYSCGFKDETGTKFSAEINLAVGETTDTSFLDWISPNSPFSDVELACACGVKGSVVDPTKPVKESSEVLCKEDPGCGLVLAGVISGNPTDPMTQTFAGQLLNFNLSKGYVFDCIRVE